MQPLDKLRDIHLPSPIGWWPLAIGWELLIISIFLLFIVAIYFFYRRRRNGRAKREALVLLSHLEAQYQQEGHSQLTSARLSELLRRVALVYFPRDRVASLQGDAWIEFLSNTSKNINFAAHRDCFLFLPYQHEGIEVDLGPVFISVRSWIKQRGVPCLN